jgi:hypothetical protein
MPGSPIRTPWDHSSVDSSPRPIAASHVLHRLLVPRHSPFALDNLTTKMLASTVQFSTNDQPTTRTAPHQQHQPTGQHPVCKAKPCLATIPHHTQETALKDNTQLFFQDPTGCSPSLPSRTKTTVPTTEAAVLGHPSRCQEKTHQCLRHMSTPPPHSGSAGSIPPFGEWCSLERR